MRLPPYLLVRDSGFYFRIAIPQDLRTHFGKTEIRKSLSTHDRHVALLKASALSANVRTIFRSLRRKMADIDDFNFDFDKIRELKIGKMKVGNTVYEGLEFDLSNPEEKQAYEDLRAEARNTPAAQPQDQPSEEALAEMRAIREAIEQSTQQRAQEKEASQSQRPAATGSSEKLSTLFAIYLQFRQKAKLTQKTLMDYQSANTLLIEVIGDKPISHVSKDDANHFTEIVHQLPPNMNKNPAYRGKSINEILSIRKKLEKEEAARRKEQPELPQGPVDFSMSVNNGDKITGCCRTFFAWALDKGYIFGANVFEGQKVQSKAQRERDMKRNRVPFDSVDMERIFSPANYATRRTPHDFWTPLIAAYGGLRLNEIAQLHLDDIIFKLGVWAFDLNEKTPDKKLKNKTSARLVPIHPALIEIGFLDFYEDVKKTGKDRLFPHLNLDYNGYSRSPSQNFARYLDSLGITCKEKVFHSLRHTFNNTLKQDGGIGEEARSELMGHAHKNINAEVYSETHRLPNKLAFIEKLTYKEIDPTALRYEKGSFDQYMQSELSPVTDVKVNEKLKNRQEALDKRRQRYLESGKALPPSLT